MLSHSLNYGGVINLLIEASHEQTSVHFKIQ